MNPRKRIFLNLFFEIKIEIKMFEDDGITFRHEIEKKKTARKKKKGKLCH